MIYAPESKNEFSCHFAIFTNFSTFGREIQRTEPAEELYQGEMHELNTDKLCQGRVDKLNTDFRALSFVPHTLSTCF